jgi:hypothetical protein
MARVLRTERSHRTHRQQRAASHSGAGDGRVGTERCEPESAFVGTRVFLRIRQASIHAEAVRRSGIIPPAAAGRPLRSRLCPSIKLRAVVFLVPGRRKHTILSFCLANVNVVNASTARRKYRFPDVWNHIPAWKPAAGQAPQNRTARRRHPFQKRLERRRQL